MLIFPIFWWWCGTRLLRAQTECGILVLSRISVTRYTVQPTAVASQPQQPSRHWSMYGRRGEPFDDDGLSRREASPITSDASSNIALTQWRAASGLPSPDIPLDLHPTIAGTRRLVKWMSAPELKRPHCRHHENSESGREALSKRQDEC